MGSCPSMRTFKTAYQKLTEVWVSSIQKVIFIFGQRAISLSLNIKVWLGPI